MFTTALLLGTKNIPWKQHHSNVSQFSGFPVYREIFLPPAVHPTAGPVNNHNCVRVQYFFRIFLTFDVICIRDYHLYITSTRSCKTLQKQTELTHSSKHRVLACLRSSVHLSDPSPLVFFMHNTNSLYLDLHKHNTICRS